MCNRALHSVKPKETTKTYRMSVYLTLPLTVYIKKRNGYTYAIVLFSDIKAALIGT